MLVIYNEIADILQMWYYNDKMELRYYSGAFEADISPSFRDMSEVREWLAHSIISIIYDDGAE